MTRASVVANSVLGGLGLVFGVVLVQSWSSIVHSPGDDNPVGLIVAWAALLCPLPAWGLVRLVRRIPVRGPLSWLWLISSSLAVLASGTTVAMIAML